MRASRRVSLQWHDLGGRPNRFDELTSSVLLRAEREATPVIERDRLREFAPRISSLRALLAETRIPTDPSANTANEEALAILTVVAEVEHALMVQYLYAMYGFPTNTGLDPEPRNKLKDIAVQEMGHLISVQNILLLLGGPDALHLGRDNVRPGNPENPLPFTLEGATVDSLATFLVAEMPSVIPADIQARVSELEARARAHVGGKLHRVGALFVKLLWLFRSEEDRLVLGDTVLTASDMGSTWRVDESLFAQPATIAEFEAQREVWAQGSVDDSFLLSPARNRQEAFALLSAISDQGEGFETAEDSHFDELYELIEQVEQATAAGTLILKPLIRSPLTAVSSAGGGLRGTFITNEYARLWAQLANVRYELLLHSLAHALATGNQRPDFQARLIDLGFKDMHLINRLAVYLTKQPAGDPTGAEFCGLPFELAADGSPQTPTEYREKHLRLLDSAAVLHSTLQAHPRFDGGGTALLSNLRTNDQQRRDFLNQNP